MMFLSLYSSYVSTGCVDINYFRLTSFIFSDISILYLFRMFFFHIWVDWEGEAFVAIEFCTNGDLLDFLKENRNSFQNLISSIPSSKEASSTVSNPL